MNRLLDNALVPYTETCVDNRALQQCILGGAVMEAGSRGRLLDLFQFKKKGIEECEMHATDIFLNVLKYI